MGSSLLVFIKYIIIYIYFPLYIHTFNPFYLYKIIEITIMWYLWRLVRMIILKKEKYGEKKSQTFCFYRLFHSYVNL